ncbi:MarR family transcriptional regulator [Allobacillus sp. SKP8-2]|uniref:MarR family transcriptional regulator n=2 Tax=Bacillaceae TaxID=186817 RepID=A0A941HSL1_9BACI|nr:MarR family transcriptional regulator [Allobacillus saliphilus]
MVAHLLENQYNEQLAVHGLTVAQSKVLFLLVENGPLSQVELQQHLYIKGSTMTGILDSLLMKDLVEKSDSEVDKRSKIISIKEKGRKLDQDLWDNLNGKEYELMEGFSEEEVALFMKWLQRMKTNLLKQKEEAK